MGSLKTLKIKHLRNRTINYRTITHATATGISMAAQTNDVHQRQIDGEKFGLLQRLRAAYQDSCLKAESEAWMELDPDFVFHENIV